MKRLLSCVFFFATSLVLAGCNGDSGNDENGGGTGGGNVNAAGNSGSGGAGDNDDAGGGDSGASASGSSLTGVWQLDIDKTLEGMSGMMPQGLPEAQQQQMMTMMRQQLGEITLEFSADGTATMLSPGGETKSAPFTVEGNEIMIEAEEGDEGPDRVTFTADEIVMEGTQNGQAMRMHFRRKSN